MAKKKTTIRKQGQKPPSSLNPRQCLFVAEYCSNGLDAAKAARVAWPNNKTPACHAHATLKKPKVKEYISKILDAKLSDLELSTEKILHHLATALFLDPIHIFEYDPIDGVYEVKDIGDIPEDVRKCITKIKSKSRIHEESGDKETYFELEFLSKEKALDLAMKYRGLIQQAGSVSMNMGKGTVEINFDDLTKPPKPEDDKVEAKIAGNGNHKLIEAQFEDSNDKDDEMPRRRKRNATKDETVMNEDPHEDEIEEDEEEYDSDYDEDLDDEDE